MNKILPAFILLFFICHPAFTQSIKDSSTFRPNLKPVLNINRTTDNAITIDGVINDTEWKNASIADNFSEVNSGVSIKPDVETKAFITYDNENLYMAFICWDDMNTLRVSMSDRDRMYDDDWVGAFIDTYSDLKQGFEFYTNAYGIQGDLIWSTNYEDSSPDFIYESEGKIYKDKWTAEIKIPFKSLRFPDSEEQIWRVHLIRNRPREYRNEIYWAGLDKNDPSFMGQSGTWKGIKNIKRSKRLEILPYVIGNISAINNDTKKFGSELKYNKFDGDLGLGIKYGLSSNLTWDLTINPDFSQVEADAPQIDINSSSAIFFNEKRPFFLEGASSFRSNLDILYTRAIVNPLFATKLTGKINKLNIGFLSAFDENTPFLIPYENGSFVRSSNKNSLSNVFRLKYDIKNEDFLGFTYSDREESNDSSKVFKFDGFNRVISADGRFQFGQSYLGIQLFYYLTKEINDTSFFNNKIKFGKDNKYDLSYNGETFHGPGAYLNFERFTRNWGFLFEYNYQSPYARRDNGFAARNNFHELFMLQEYTFYPDSKLIRRINPELYADIRHTSDGKLKEQYLEQALIIEFKNGLSLFGNYVIVNNEDYRGVYHTGVHRWTGEISYNYKNKISGTLNYTKGKYIVRFADPSYVGKGQNIYAGITINPVDRIRLIIDYNYSDLFSQSTNKNIYRGYVLSATAYYVFNKYFFLRLVGQYDDFDKVLNFDPLLSYKWNPFTTFFIGSTHHFHKESNFKEADRKIFAKFQYLWSM